MCYPYASNILIPVHILLRCASQHSCVLSISTSTASKSYAFCIYINQHLFPHHDLIFVCNMYSCNSSKKNMFKLKNTTAIANPKAQHGEKHSKEKRTGIDDEDCIGDMFRSFTRIKNCPQRIWKQNMNITASFGTKIKNYGCDWWLTVVSTNSLHQISTHYWLKILYFGDIVQ